jgi:hypothetical protein
MSRKVVLVGTGKRPQIRLEINQGGILVHVNLEPQHARQIHARLGVAIEGLTALRDAKATS